MVGRRRMQRLTVSGHDGTREICYTGRKPACGEAGMAERFRTRSCTFAVRCHGVQTYNANTDHENSSRSNQAKRHRNNPLINPRTRWESEQKEMKDIKVRNFFFSRNKKLSIEARLRTYRGGRGTLPHSRL